MQLARRYVSILAINIIVLGFAFVLDTLLEPLSPTLQFFLQVPTLVLAIDEFRRWVLARADRFGLSELEINAAFFFSAPLAAVGSDTLLTDLRKLVPFGRFRIWN